MSTAPQDLPALGSLAQSARAKSLKSARGLLIAIGVLTAAANAFFFAMARNRVQNEVVKLQGQGKIVDPQAVETAIRTTQLFAAASIALGVLFVVFGLIVQKFPVPITVTGLVLYIGAAVVFGLLDPTQLARGIIVKIIIVAALAKAIQAALAYERESAATPALGSLP